VRYPQDTTPYPADSRSQPIDSTVLDGSYVYVQDISGIIRIVPDGQHMHPRVLGGGLPAKYAGDMTIRGGRVVDITNLSGTFQFDDEDGLREIALELREQGLIVAVGAVRIFPADGSRPIILE